MPEKGTSGRNVSQKVSPNCGVGVLTWAKLLRPGLRSFAQVKIPTPYSGETLCKPSLGTLCGLSSLLFSSLLFSSLLFSSLFFSSLLVSSRLVSSRLVWSHHVSSLLLVEFCQQDVFEPAPSEREGAVQERLFGSTVAVWQGQWFWRGSTRKGPKAYNKHIERIPTCDSKRHIFTGCPAMWSDLLAVLDASKGARLETDTTTRT